MKHSYPTATDQFCGAGGSTSGAKEAGVEVKMAMNHWPLALETHNTNHPEVDHDCADMSASDPRRYPGTDILITSPECFPAGTLILTARGLTPIEQVLVGDMVLTHLNRWQPVTNVMDAVRDTVIVRGQGHRALEVTAEHPFYARRQSQKWNQPRRSYDTRILDDPEWAAAKELKSATYRWASPARVPAPLVPPVVGDNARGVEFTVEFWWMVGRWLGDGTVRLRDDASSEITVCCGKHEVEELERLHFAPREGLHSRRNELHWRKREIRTSYLFECTHDSLARWLVEHFGRHAHGKTMPAWAFGMSHEWREALLNGYVSADGSQTDRYTMAGSASKALALGIRILATTLGYHPTFAKYRHKAGQIEGRPFEEYDLWTVRWENNKSQRTGYNNGEHSWTLVKELQAGHKAVPVYNLAVAEDESYVADGIVVHNCTNHSIAKGRRRPHYVKDLFGNLLVDPASERSRATMWDVVRFAEFHNYRIVVVENVVDAREWVLYDDWLRAMYSLGYDHKAVYFNSMFAHPTPQSRDRMYVVFWKRGNTAPDLEFTPLSWCPKCEQNVDGRQSWKNPRRQYGRYGKRGQYVYRCGACSGEVFPFYYPALTAIDWSLPIERIGDRKKPLQEKTLARIRLGLERFANEHLVMDILYSHAHNNRSHPVTEPWPTQTGQQSLALVRLPFIGVQREHSTPRDIEEALQTIVTDNQHFLIDPSIVELRNNSTVRSLAEALSTVTAGGGHHGLLMPFLTRHYNSRGGEAALSRPVTEPLGSITTADHHSLTVPPFLTSYYGQDTGHALDEAMPTVPTHDRHALVAPFIVSQYGGEKRNPIHCVGEPMMTVPGMALHRLALPGETPSVEDCGFRMLAPHEIQAAMAFPSDYIVLGNKREQVKQLGNAVTPPVMRQIIERCVATLGGES